MYIIQKNKDNTAKRARPAGRRVALRRCLGRLAPSPQRPAPGRPQRSRLAQAQGPGSVPLQFSLCGL